MWVLFVGINGLYFLLLRRRGFRAKRPPRLRPGYTFDPARSVSMRGFGRIRFWNASAPLVKITFDRRWVKISGFVPLVWIPREAVTAITSSRLSFSRVAHFVTRDGAYDGVLVGSLNSRALFEALASLGWPVEGEIVSQAGVVCWRCREPSAKTDQFCQKCGGRLNNP